MLNLIKTRESDLTMDELEEFLEKQGILDPNLRISDFEKMDEIALIEAFFIAGFQSPDVEQRFQVFHSLLKSIKDKDKHSKLVRTLAKLLWCVEEEN